MMIDFNTLGNRSIAGSQPNPTAVRQYEASKKSVAMAFVAWLVLGGIGMHRFYVGDNKGGLAILLITLVSVLLKFALIGHFTIWITVVWVFVDAFLIHDMVEKSNSALAASLGLDAVAMQHKAAAST